MLDHEKRDYMLNTGQKPRNLGFTLVELMIGIVIIAILLSTAIPSFRSWMLDTQVRNAAESVQSGLQRARSEAVSRNSNITFTLGAGTSWIVDVVPPPPVASGIPPIDSRASNEGSRDVTLIGLAADTPLTFPPTFNTSTPATTITLNNLGGVAANAPVGGVTPPPLARVDFSAVGSVRSLRITVGAGGNAKMCDPSLPATNPRGC